MKKAAKNTTINSGPWPCSEGKSGVDRRGFLRGAAGAVASLLLRGFPALGAETKPDYSLEISEIEWEIAPKKKIKTAAYNGKIPGPLLRLTESKPVTIDIVNRRESPEIVHWHGQWIPPDVDGAMEEGSPMIPPGGRTRIQFTPKPSGLHWYHTHSHADHELKHGLYTGQFGILWVEPRNNAGRYDQEQFLTLHEWEPYPASSDDGSMEIAYGHGTVNGHMLGSGEPIRVRSGERVLLHIVNTSATLVHWLTLPGHKFEVLSMDGRPVPTRASVPNLRLGPAERVSCIVEMTNPGVWILGEADPKLRDAGMGIVIEYAGQSSAPKGQVPDSLAWDYSLFGDPTPQSHQPDVTIPLVFTSKFQGHGAMDRWEINGKSYPDYDPVILKQGMRHRLVFINRSRDDHPIHLHRHAFELITVRGTPTSGVFKDVVLVKAGTKVEVDLVADNPGATLFHCHQQDHMDAGFMTLFRYA